MSSPTTTTTTRSPLSFTPVQALYLLLRLVGRPSFASSSPPSSSTTLALSTPPVLPRTARWLLVLIALLNYRALPGVWHLRVFWSIIVIRLRGLFKWSNHTKRRQFVKELSPVGENPFDICVTYKTTVGLTDTDYNGHLSNSSYAKNLDYARMKAAVVCFPSVLEAKGWLGLGSSHFYFIKEIPLLTEYEIRINIGGWDNKWLNLVVQFVTYPNGRGKDARRQSRNSRDSTPTPIAGGDTSRNTPLAYTPPTRYYITGTAAGAEDEAYIPPPQPPVEAVEEEEEDACTTAAHVGTDDSFTSSASISSSSSRSSTETTSSEPRSRSVSDSSFTTQASCVSESEEGFFTAEEENSSLGSSTAASSPPSLSPHKMSTDLPVPPHSHSPPSATGSQETNAGAERVPHPLIDAMPALPEGALLHCIHVSSYCFKHGRITIPPRVALVVSGFGDPERKRWERVQHIRDTKSYPIDPAHLSSTQQDQPCWTGLQAILRGGWRQYEHEGLWDLPEYEEQRLAALDAFGSLRGQMAAAGAAAPGASAGIAK